MNYNFYEDFNTLNNFNNFTNNDMSNENMPNIDNNVNNNLNLYNTLEGYSRGNLFRNLYEPYKNYQPRRLQISSEKEELLTSIGEYSFAAHELNLYLDVYPNDQNALNLYNKYRKQANELINKYERKYGPINVSGINDTNVPFNWSTSIWPWEV